MGYKVSSSLIVLQGAEKNEGKWLGGEGRGGFFREESVWAPRLAEEGTWLGRVGGISV